MPNCHFMRDGQAIAGAYGQFLCFTNRYKHNALINIKNKFGILIAITSLLTKIKNGQRERTHAFRITANI